MARRDGSARVRIAIRIPAELDGVINLMTNQHRFDSKSSTIRYLIESHPEVLTIVEAFCYTEPQRDTQTQGV